MKVKLIADRITVSGPRIDGTYKITLETGEYLIEEITKVMKMKGNIIITLEEEDHAQEEK